MKTKLCGIISLLFLFLIQFTFAQKIIITGVVSDASGTLPGASVIIEDTAKGTVTDLNGIYTIEASPGENLRFSYVGKAVIIRTVGSNNIINVIMVDESKILEEVLVVTALGIQRQKKTLTYQADNVKSKDLVSVIPVRAAQGLTGKVAGLQINVQDNGVNPSTQIILRGLRSITQSNSALIVIDGSISTQGAFDDLNPLDIENINVLKGATAGVLYGSLGSNGVLIVTTKKGKENEKFTVGLSSTSTFETVSYMPDFQMEYGTGWYGEYDPIENTNWGPRFDGEVRQIGPTFADGSFQAVPYAPVKDNLLDFYNTGTTLQNTLYFSGGGKNSSFYLSVGDQHTTGVIPSDTYNRNTFRVNASQTLGKLTLSLNSGYLRDHTSVVGSRLGTYDLSIYELILFVATNIPLTEYSDWDNPKSFGYADNYYNGYIENPYWAIGTSRDDDTTSRLTANIQASWDIKEWLNFTTRLGINTSNGHGKDFRHAQSYDSTLQPYKGYVSSFVIESEFQFLSYTTDAILNANFDINKLFNITAILGATNKTTELRKNSIRANDLVIPGFFDISNGTGTSVVNLDESKKRTYGFFADATIGYADFLFLNLAGRYDFTSTLPKDNNSYFYPTIGLSFVLSEAMPSIRDKDTYMKFTVSNSTIYNDLGAYQINETFSQAESFPYGSLNGFDKSEIAVDPDITKEKINTSEFGINLAFFKNRLTFDAAYFITKSTDLITLTTPSLTSASSSILTNIGEIKSKGIELTLGGSILRSEDWGWDANVNYSSNESIVKEITQGVSEVKVSDIGELSIGYLTPGELGFYAIVGEAFPQIKATSYVRDPQGHIVIDPVDGNPIIGPLKNLGKTTPDYIVGLTSSFRWKALNLSATLDYRTGHVYYEFGSDMMEFTGRSVASVSHDRQDFVLPNSVVETSPGVYIENTDITVTDGNMLYWMDIYWQIKENYVKDATAFKIRELALNYELPNKFLHNSPVKTLRIGFIARNYFTFLPGENRFSDPEFQNQQVSSNAIGIGGFYQPPPTRSLGININIEF